MVVENILYGALSELDMLKQTCSETDDTSHELAKDYLLYFIFIVVYTTIFIILYILFFRPAMKRSKADTLIVPPDNVETVLESHNTTESVTLLSKNVNLDDQKRKMHIDT